jgi:superfamily II DNA or RNA helicase
MINFKQYPWLFYRLIIFFFSSAAQVASISPFVPHIHKVIEDSDVSDITRHHGFPTTILPGQVFYAKSKKTALNYPDGIHQFTITNSEKLQYLFNSLPQFKGKKILLHIIINEDVKEASIALPAIDTVVEGNNLDKFMFFLGSREEPNNAHYYFFADTQNPHAKISIRARGQVYATRPDKFVFDPETKTTAIKPLKRHEFFFAHTKNMLAIPADTTNLENNLRYDDVHNRPAKNHQIQQIVEYLIASERGHKYFTVAASTGSGKTNTMLRLAEIMHPKKILIVTSRLNLVDQIKKEAKLYYGNLSIAEKLEEQNFKQFVVSNTNKDISVVTLQAFQGNYTDRDIIAKYDAIIFDEAHNLLSLERSKMVNALKAYENKRLEIFFFTATPTQLYEHKKSKLKSVFQLSDEFNDGQARPHITPLNIKEAIARKVNVPLQIVYLSNLIKKHEQWEVGQEFIEEDVRKSISHDKFHRVILDFYLNTTIKRPGLLDEVVFGKKTMFFTAGIDHAEKLSNYLNENYFELLNDMQRDVLVARVIAYKNAVNRHFTNKEKASDFLKQYPFMFADSIHSGNKAYVIKDQDMDNRILRNQLGGSLMFCGDVKLMEGYDNPGIEVAIMLRPRRRSSTAIIQQVGRILRPDPENPNKVGIAVQAIWDERQLLLSSTDLFGAMSIGLPANLILSASKHLADTIDYQLSTTMNMEGSTSRGSKRRVSTSSDCESLQKKPRVERPVVVTEEEKLIEQLLDLFQRIQEKAKLLFQFTVHNDQEHESLESSSSSSTTTTMPTSSMGKRDNTSQNRDTGSKDEEDDYELELLSHTNQAITQLESLLKPQSTAQGVPAFGARPQAEASGENKNKVHGKLRKILTRAKRILKRGEEFFTRSQMSNGHNHAAAVLDEWKTLSQALNPLLETYNQLSDAADPLRQKIVQVAEMFDASQPQTLFDRARMRKFFCDNLWEGYIADNLDGKKITPALVDQTFSKLVSEILRKVITPRNASIMLGYSDGKRLEELYGDLPIVQHTLTQLQEQFIQNKQKELEEVEYKQAAELKEFEQLCSASLNRFDAVAEAQANMPAIVPLITVTSRIVPANVLKAVPEEEDGEQKLADEKFLGSPVDNYTKQQMFWKHQRYPQFHQEISRLNREKELNPSHTVAHDLIKKKLLEIGADERDVALGSYAAALFKKMGPGLAILDIPIFKASLLSPDAQGKFASHHFGNTLFSVRGDLIKAIFETMATSLHDATWLTNVHQSIAPYYAIMRTANFASPEHLELAIFTAETLWMIMKFSHEPSLPSLGLSNQLMAQLFIDGVKKFMYQGENADTALFEKFYWSIKTLCTKNDAAAIKDLASKGIDWALVRKHLPPLKAVAIHMLF